MAKKAIPIGRKVRKKPIKHRKLMKVNATKRKRLINFTGPLQASQDAVPPLHPAQEGLIDSLYQHGKIIDLAYESAPLIYPAGSVHAYIKALIVSGMTTKSLELLTYCTPKNRTNFCRSPQQYITIIDMLLVKGLLGISIDRQVQLLISGMTSGESARNGEGLHTSVKSILNTIPRAPGAPSLPPDVAPLEDSLNDSPAQVTPPVEGPVIGSLFNIDPLNL
jgi:hypothetical protein